MAMKYSVFLQDTDPDSGVVSQMIKMCECSEERSALQIKHALSQSDDGDPNREYVIQSHEKRENLIICTGTDQLEMAWAFQLWLREKGIRAIVCFSNDDLSLVTTTFLTHGIPYSIMLVHLVDHDVPTPYWNGVEFDLEIGKLHPSDFEEILNSLK